VVHDDLHRRTTSSQVAGSPCRTMTQGSAGGLPTHFEVELEVI
jgi:hypothetical protein